MIFTTPQFAGPHDPATTTPARTPGSVRRTTSIDCLRPDGLAGDLVVDARARDLRTGGPGGDAAEEVRLEAVLESAGRRVLDVRTEPTGPGWQEMVGVRVGPGFRTRLGAVAAAQADPSSLLYLLLDDLVGANLVSGYALLHGGAFEPGGTPTADQTRAIAAGMAGRGDLCAGWATGGSFMVTIRTEGRTPAPLGPPAPLLERADDPRSWHAMAPLPPHGVRRRRRIDVVPSGDVCRFDVLFRDSHVDADGAETVVHEYAVDGTVEWSGTLSSVTAQGRVLPWLECPGALASAGRLVGSPVTDLRTVVRADFVGVTTCTHLNDTLRGLEDLGTLLAQVPDGWRPAA